MKYEDIVTRRSYTKDGNEKVVWLKCGTLRTTDDGKKFIEMNDRPETTFYVFQQKEKVESKEGGW